MAGEPEHLSWVERTETPLGACLACRHRQMPYAGGVLSDQPERRQPLPSVGRLPGHLLGGLTPRQRWLVLATAVALVAAIVAAAVAFVPSLRAERDAKVAAESRQAAADRAALRARLDREARAVTGIGPAAKGVATGRVVATRRRLLEKLEAGVLADARLRAGRGELKGAYGSAVCFEFPKRLTELRPEQQTRRSVMRMECIAVASKVRRSELSTGSLIGQPFRARVDFAQGRFAWCKIVQRPGELSIQQAMLRVPRRCGG